MNEHKLFWSLHPALSVGVSFLLGIGSTLFHLPLLIPTVWALYLILVRKWASFFLLPLGSIYAFALFGNLPEFEEPIECTAAFSISSLQPHSSPFHKDLVYKGTLYYESNALPCTVIWKKKEKPIANCDYQVSGSLIQRDRFDYLLKAIDYEPIRNTWSLAELRYKAKQAFALFLGKKLIRPRTALLLSSLATGDIDDRMLRFEFGRLGLQHLLAISGFHFSLLLVFLSLILGSFLPHRWKWAFMLLCMTGYFLFIGSSPAVQRAWIVASLVLAGKMLRRPSSPFNLLGAALFIELALDPLVAVDLGFQLSFGCCFGILLLYQPLEKALRGILPRRPVSKSIRLSTVSQILYIGSTTFRSSIAMTFAVNTAILPLLLYHFGRFPLMGLLYNLFFPFLISLALFGLMTALVLNALAPPVASPLFCCLDWFAAQLLDLTAYPPLIFDYSLYCPEFPYFLIPVYLFCLFAYSLRFQNTYENIYVYTKGDSKFGR